MKSKTSAFLFSWFLGGLGIHRFYLGQIGWGIIYLIFFWTFIPAICAFIEGILFLTMSEETFNAKYNPSISLKKSPKEIAEIVADLHKLKLSGAITETEFEIQKAKALNG